MIRVLQSSGRVGLLFFGLLCLHLPPFSTQRELTEEESKSLWHQLADAMLVVHEDDRDRFLDICLKRRIMCNTAGFRGPNPNFRWRAGVTQANKDRFWHTYTCAYNRDITQCPVDGGWSSWSPWSACSAACDSTGNQTRTRTCSNPVPVRGGERCHGSLMRSRPCLGSCTDPSKEGGVSEAKAFLKQVHDAYPDIERDCYNAHCTYGVVKEVIFDKYVREKYWSSLNCVKYNGACPVDGKWSPWSSWTFCSLKCGTGSRTRTRTCDQPPPAFGGHPCKGEFHDLQSCIMKDCGATTTETFTEWTKWSPCSISCGSYGIQTATRVCLRHVGCDLMGVLTPYVNRSRPCFAGDCPRPGGWSEWSEWTDCSAACGSGRQSRLRFCDSPFASGGLYCLGDPLDFRLCKGDTCAGQPSPPENTGFIQRPGEIEEDVIIGKSDEYLNGPLNTVLEALYTPWTPWSMCTVSCGQGNRKRTRWCSAQTTPMPPCEGEVRQIQFCNVFVCPVSGGWGVWMPWTPCSSTCGKGKRQRYRSCNNPLPQFGGSCDGDHVRSEDCDMGPCPHVANGAWSKWSPWSSCTVTCGAGERTRSRHRHFGQSESYSVPASPSSEEGSQETLDCNTQPCPVDGGWAQWEEWSRCSELCGLGRRTRDRTCTDPAPVFSGEVCPGRGTDLTHCFAGPCKDAEDRAIHMGRTSWIHYAPRNRPTRFLVLYLHFKPMVSMGALVRRYRQCRSVFDDAQDNKDDNVDDEDKDNDSKDRKADEDEKCELVVELTLQIAQVQLSVLARGTKLDIKSPIELSLGAWHEILVEVMKSGASLRINDHDRQYANFSRQLVKDLDFDSYMTIGATDNSTAGVACSISSLSVNFKTQDLFASADWEGQGTHVGRHAVAVQTINPSIQLPHFRGLYYSPLRLYHIERLSVRLTMALDQGEGLLLYVPGQAEGTLVSLGLKHSRLVICMVCSRALGNVCHHADLLRLHQWYHVSLSVDSTEAELRVDQDKAVQLACKGLPFRPRKTLYVGGRGPSTWSEVQRATNYTEGFLGVLGTIVVNGRTVSFRQAVLLGRDKRINPDGYSRASRITPVFEHKTSLVTLHCEVDKPDDPLVEIKIIWLLSDSILEARKYIDIIKPVGREKLVGTLQLQPGGNTEGIYACLVSTDGLLELKHVFPVFRHTAAQDLYEGNLEWLLLKLLLILVLLLAVCAILYRHRQKFIDLYFKLLRKERRGPEKEPLLTTDTMDVFVPQEQEFHTSDETASLDAYREQNEGDLSKFTVVNYGPAEARQLSTAPGTASDRSVLVTDGQVRFSDNPRKSASNYPEFLEEAHDEVLYVNQSNNLSTPNASGTSLKERLLSRVRDTMRFQTSSRTENACNSNRSYSRNPAVHPREKPFSIRPACHTKPRPGGSESRAEISDVEQSHSRNPVCHVDFKPSSRVRRRSHSGDRSDNDIKPRDSRCSSLPRNVRVGFQDGNHRHTSVGRSDSRRNSNQSGQSHRNSSKCRDNSRRTGSGMKPYPGSEGRRSDRPSYSTFPQQTFSNKNSSALEPDSDDDSTESGSLSASSTSQSFLASSSSQTSCQSSDS